MRRNFKILHPLLNQLCKLFIVGIAVAIKNSVEDDFVIILLLLSDLIHQLFDLVELCELVNQRAFFEEKNLCIIYALNCALSPVFLIFGGISEVDVKKAVFVSEIGPACVAHERNIKSLRLFVDHLVWERHHVAYVLVQIERAFEDEDNLISEITLCIHDIALVQLARL